MVGLLLGGPPTTQPDSGPFESLRAMTPKQKKAMKSENYHLHRLKKRIQQAMTCKACKGSGRVAVRVQEPGQRAGVNREVTTACGTCGGSRKASVGKAYDLLAEYIQRRESYEEKYPFVGKIKLGVEELVIKRINDSYTILGWNAVFRPLLQGRALRKGDVLIIGTAIIDVTEDERNVGVLPAMVPLDRLSDNDPVVEMWIDGEVPRHVSGWSNVVIIATYEKAEEYVNVLGESRVRHVLMVKVAKNMGGVKMPWDW
jgi:hypothetical protein